MGRGYEVRCRTCSFHGNYYLGVGFSFPMLYESAMDDIKSGEYGEDLRRWYEEHPEAAVDPTIVLLQCPRCGILETERNMSMYLPLPDYDHEQRERVPWSSAVPGKEEDYVSPFELREHYTLCRPYRHTCRKCGAEAETVSEDQILEASLICPQCGGKAELAGRMLWD